MSKTPSYTLNFSVSVREVFSPALKMMKRKQRRVKEFTQTTSSVRVRWDPMSLAPKPRKFPHGVPPSSGPIGPHYPGRFPPSLFDFDS